MVSDLVTKRGEDTASGSYELPFHWLARGSSSHHVSDHTSYSGPSELLQKAARAVSSLRSWKQERGF